MKKKTLSLALVLCIVLSLISVLPTTASAATEGIYTYTVEDGKTRITRIESDTDEVITIPETLGGYTVTSLGPDAFMFCYSLTEVTIPATVVSIDSAVFNWSDTLQNINVSEDNQNYSSIDGNLFDKSKTTLIKYANGKTDATYTIPDTVTTINENAFYGCDNLSGITISDKITSIGSRAFHNYGFEYINVDENNPNYSSIDGILFNKSKTTIIQYPTKKPDTEYTVPSGVTTIGKNAFSSSNNLTKVVISDTVTTLDEYSFSTCYSLKEIIIPDSVTYIGAHSFSYCPLENVVLPSKITSIKANTFIGCGRLTSIVIPKGITRIYKSAFNTCYALKDAYFTGSEEEWKTIPIESQNYCLTDATIHYNYVPTSEVTYGDASGDGKINALDRATMSRYIAKWADYNEYNVNLTASDINSDGKMNALDRAIISRHIAKWAGYETLPYTK